jgi:hypothetical protein
MQQESLGMGAFDVSKTRNEIQQWIEVWDYSGDAIYRGFITERNKERTMFVFFDRALDHGLKSGYVTSVLPWTASCQGFPFRALSYRILFLTLPSLIALFELAEDTFGCSQIVACVSRSQPTDEMELVRSLGWCGFSLTTLEPWMSSSDQGCLSNEWLFLAAEV